METISEESKKLAEKSIIEKWYQDYNDNTCIYANTDYTQEQRESALKEMNDYDSKMNDYDLRQYISSQIKDYISITGRSMKDYFDNQFNSDVENNKKTGFFYQNR